MEEPIFHQIHVVVALEGIPIRIQVIMLLVKNVLPLEQMHGTTLTKHKRLNVAKQEVKITSFFLSVDQWQEIFLDDEGLIHPHPFLLIHPAPFELPFQQK